MSGPSFPIHDPEALALWNFTLDQMGYPPVDKWGKPLPTKEELEELAIAAEVAANFGKPKLKLTTMFVVFSTPDFLVYWQGIPDIDMGSLPTLEDLLPFTKARIMGRGNKAPRTPELEFYLQTLAKGYYQKIWSTKDIHLGIIQNMMDLGMELNPNTCLDKGLAKERAKEYLAFITSYLVQEGFKTPQEFLAKEFPKAQNVTKLTGKELNAFVRSFDD